MHDWLATVVMEILKSTTNKKKSQNSMTNSFNQNHCSFYSLHSQGMNFIFIFFFKI